jgi:hypothetical protein
VSPDGRVSADAGGRGECRDGTDGLVSGDCPGGDDGQELVGGPPPRGWSRPPGHAGETGASAPRRGVREVESPRSAALLGSVPIACAAHGDGAASRLAGRGIAHGAANESLWRSPAGEPWRFSQVKADGRPTK